jgi:hypothetical protein
VYIGAQPRALGLDDVAVVDRLEAAMAWRSGSPPTPEELTRPGPASPFSLGHGRL